jgi:hypothetical protein
MPSQSVGATSLILFSSGLFANRHPWQMGWSLLFVGIHLRRELHPQESVYNGCKKGIASLKPLILLVAHP